MTTPHKQKAILVDARELVTGRVTGIGRMLIGLVASLSESTSIGKIVLALPDKNALPDALKGHERIASMKTPPSFLDAEWTLSQRTRRGYNAFISPYRKLPLFGVHCPAVHTIHDVLDLTNPLYRKKFKTFLDIYRLKRALGKAALTWYDSRWSMKETGRVAKITGRKPRVQYLGVDERFNEVIQQVDFEILTKYALKAREYILVLGNGLPHKNLGLLLDISDRVFKRLVFVGVSKRHQRYWEKRHPTKKGIWIEHVEDEEMPTLLRHAFCLAQPSLEEGYGYPPLEAMACGTPAVVSAIEVLIETTGGNTLVAGTHDEGSWLEAFSRLENTDCYHTQANKGLQWTANLKGRKGWQGHVADIEELIGGNP